MMKINWTCTECGLWVSTPKDSMKIVDTIPQLICEMCGHNSTDELVATEPVHHVSSIAMLAKKEG